MKTKVNKKKALKRIKKAIMQGMSELDIYRVFKAIKDFKEVIITNEKTN